MVTYVDTQAGGVNNDLIQGGTFEWPLSQGTKFYLNAVNNLIQGQQSGQGVTFKVQDLHGSQTVTVGYGQAISRAVKGHLVTTVPATLPTSPNVDVHIILDDDPVPLQTQTTNQIAVTSSSGSSAVPYLVAFPEGAGAGSASYTNIYTVPLTNRATIQSVLVTLPSGSTDQWQLEVLTLTGGRSASIDYLTSETTGNASIGQGPGNTVQLNPPKIMNPGDILQIADFTNPGTGGTVNMSIKLEPL